MRLSFSERAAADVREIAHYSSLTWGRERARRYLVGLRAKLERLQHHPELGQPADEVRAGLRRYPYISHNIFYRIQPDGIRIVRVLHKQMQVERHVG